MNLTESVADMVSRRLAEVAQPITDEEYRSLLAEIRREKARETHQAQLDGLNEMTRRNSDDHR